MVTAPKTAPTTRPSRRRRAAKTGVTTGPPRSCLHCNKPGHTQPNCKTKQTPASLQLPEKRQTVYILARDARRKARATENALLARAESIPTIQYDTHTDNEQNEEDYFPSVLSIYNTPLVAPSCPLHLRPSLRTVKSVNPHSVSFFHDCCPNTVKKITIVFRQLVPDTRPCAFQTE